MPVMSIIACRILEEEIFHVLSLENAFDYLFVTDTKEAHGLVRRLKKGNTPYAPMPSDRIPDMLRQTRSSCKRNIIRRICMKPSAKEDFIVVVHILELGLHRDLTSLRRGVYAAVEQMSSYSDGILLFYGLCGNSLQNIENDLSHITCPIYLLKDSESNRVDDCISIALGGNRKYEEAFEACRGKGTLFFTPMWASNWKDMDAPRNKQEDLMTINDSFKRQHISRIVRIDKSTRYDPAFEENVKNFAQRFGLEIISMPGTAEIVEKCYSDARNAITNGCK
jgi:hypothetical protein